MIEQYSIIQGMHVHDKQRISIVKSHSINSPCHQVCGIYSTICDVSSEESTPGRPAAVPDSYGPGTRSGSTGSSYDSGTGRHSESDIGTC